MFIIDTKVHLSETRQLTIKAGGNVVIQDETNKSEFDIPSECWLSFTKEFESIESAVKLLCDKQLYAKYFHHIGKGLYVSVTPGFRCVDIRRFYVKLGSLNPTRKGVALKLPEWRSLYGALRAKLPVSDAACRGNEESNHSDDVWSLASSSPFTIRTIGQREITN